MSDASELKFKIPFANYCNVKAVNVSTLLLYAGVTPEEGRFEELHPKKDTTSLVKGHATHAAVLEPNVFADTYCCMPSFGDRRTNAAKAAEAEWLRANGDKIALTEAENDAALGASKRLLESPITHDLFTGLGQNEVSVFWTDKATGLKCKARLDRLTEWHGYQTLADIKTAYDISDRGIATAIGEYRYPTRMAWYSDALALIRPAEWRVVFAWAKNKPSYEVRVTECDEDAMTEGRAQYRALLDLYAECLAADKWPSYPEGIEVVNPPRWYYTYTQPKGIL